MGIFPKVRGQNKKYLKPPPSITSMGAQLLRSNALLDSWIRFETGSSLVQKKSFTRLRISEI